MFIAELFTKIQKLETLDKCQTTVEGTNENLQQQKKKEQKTPQKMAKKKKMNYCNRQKHEYISHS